MAGGPLAERSRAQVAQDVKGLGGIGLATVQVGEDPASTVYIRRKHEAAGEAVIASTDLKLPEDITQEELDEAQAVLAIDPVKDVDGVHPFNAGQLYLGRPTLVPATPLGIMALLEEYQIGLSGTRAVVIGRSDIVGKPIAHLLLQANATVTICHSHTADLERHTLDADVLVVAAGLPGIVSPDMVKSGGAVIDVGINSTEAGLVGDVDPGAAAVAHFLTPVPGGVGPMTIAMVLANTVRAARYRRGLLAFPKSER